MKRIIFQIGFLLFLFVFSSCEKNETAKLSAEQSKNAISSASQNIQAEITELKNQKGVLAINELNELPEVFVGKKASSKQISSLILAWMNSQQDILAGNYKKDYFSVPGLPDLSAYTGTHTWNASTGSWDFLPSVPSNKIIVNYPAAGSPSNNATLSIVEFTDESFVVNIEVDNVEVFALNLSLSYSSLGLFPSDIPYRISLDVLCQAYAFQLTVNSAFKSEFFASECKFSFKKGAELLFSSNIDISLGLQTATIQGRVQLLSLELRGTLIENGYDNSSKPDLSAENLNKISDLKIYSYPAGAEIGKVVFEDGDSSILVFVELENGEKVELENFWEANALALNL